MLKTFKTYQLALGFHKEVIQEKIPGYLRDQLFRASSSIALNLAEGSGRMSRRDQVKFYFIALGSLRECQACLEFLPKKNPALEEKADELGACLYVLCQNMLKGSRKWN